LKNLVFMRTMAFFVDFFLWISFLSFYFSFADLKYFASHENLLLVFFFFPFLFVFLFYFITYKYFEGFSIGNKIFMIKLINLETNEKKLTNKQTLLRIFYNFLGLLFPFYNFLTKDNNYQSFTEIFTKTAFIYSKDLNKLNKEDFLSKYNKNSFFMFVLKFIVVILMLCISFYYIDNDFKNSREDIKSEFFMSVNKNLQSINLKNKILNRKVEECIWDSEEKILGMPSFVYELYFFDKKHHSKTRKKLNKFYTNCINEIYYKDNFK